jgi:hypothetical protein
MFLTWQLLMLSTLLADFIQLPIRGDIVDGTGTIPLQFEIELHPGWNLISFPLTPVAPEASSVLANSVVIGHLWSWSGEQYHSVERVQAGIGYWAYCLAGADEAAYRLPVAGFCPGNPTCTVPANKWTLLGTMGVCTAAQCGESAELWSWNAQQQRYEKLHSSETLAPGKGYWLRPAEETEVDLATQEVSSTLSLVVSPRQITLAGAGASQTLKVEQIMSDGCRRDSSDAESGTLYVSLDPRIVEVSPDGKLTSIGPGRCYVRASHGEFSAICDVTVTETGIELESLTITNGNLHFESLGENELLEVTGHFSDGSQQTIPGAELFYWTNPAGIVGVGRDGMAEALSAGCTTLLVKMKNVEASVSANVTIAPTPPAAEALENLDTLVQEQDAVARTTWNPTTGRPAALLSSSGFLGEPSPLPPAQATVQFLRKHRDLYGLSDGAIDQFETENVYGTPDIGLQYATLVQKYQGIPVYGQRLRATLDWDGRIVALVGDYCSALDVSLQAGIAPAAALLAVAQAADPGTPFEPEILTSAESPTRETGFAAGPYSGTHTASLMIIPQAENGTLVWRVNFCKSFDENLIGLVDAGTGQVIRICNGSNHADSYGQGLYFELSPDLGDRVSLDFSPNWVIENLVTVQSRYERKVPFSTYGNNIFAGANHDWVHADNIGQKFDTIAPYSPAQDTPDFSFPFQDRFRTSGGADPITDMDAAILNVFCLGNLAHERFLQLGFDWMAGNYEFDSSGTATRDRDPILVQIQNGWTERRESGAWFSPAPDGSPAVISMGLTGFRQDLDHPFRDLALSAQVFYHEYTHGVTNRLCGGPYLVGEQILSSLQGAAISEGCSDFFAASFTENPIIGAYFTGNPSTGCRQYALNANPCHYADLPLIGHPESHADGELWSATLWDVRTRLVDEYGHDTGVKMAEQLLIDALKMTATEPTLLDLRDSILIAERCRYGGRNQHLLWECFAARGMGLSAATEGPNDVNPSEAYDVPGGVQAYLQADRREILPGETVTLTWKTQEATSVSIEPGLGSVASKGSIQVQPTSTTAFELTASDGASSTHCRQVVLVRNPEDAISLTVWAEPMRILYGESFHLGWDARNARSVEVKGGQFGEGENLPPSLTQDLCIFPKQTATYTMTAIGGGGILTKSLSVQVDRPEGEAILLATPTPLILNSIGQTAPLTCTLAFADGTSRDVTRHPSIRYGILSDAAVSLNEQGLATARHTGACTVVITFNGIETTVTCLVADKPGALLDLGVCAIGACKALALDGQYAYASTEQSVGVISLANALAPQIVNQVNANYEALTADTASLHGLAGTHQAASYSLAQPQNPQFSGGTDEGHTNVYAPNAFRQGDASFLLTRVIGYSGDRIAFVRCDYAGYDFSQGAPPQRPSFLYNLEHAEYPSWPGGDSWLGTGCPVGAGRALVGGTSQAGNPTAGIGLILALNISSASTLGVIAQTECPGTKLVTGVAVNGDQGVAVGCAEAFGFIEGEPSPVLTGLPSVSTFGVSGGAVSSVAQHCVPLPLAFRPTYVEPIVPFPGQGGFYPVCNALLGNAPVLALMDARRAQDIVLHVRTMPGPCLEAQLRDDVLYSVGDYGFAMHYVGHILHNSPEESDNLVLPEGGKLRVTLVGTEAKLQNELLLQAPVSQSILTATPENIGQFVDIGPFPEGATLKLAIRTSEGQTYHMDPALNGNQERLVKSHVYDAASGAHYWICAWEDGDNLGDRDFNDMIVLVETLQKTEAQPAK